MVNAAVAVIIGLTGTESGWSTSLHDAGVMAIGFHIGLVVVFGAISILLGRMTMNGK